MRSCFSRFRGASPAGWERTSLLALVFVLCFAGIPHRGYAAGEPASEQPEIFTATGQASLKSPPNLITAIEQVAEQTIPAVVHVEVTERQEVPNPFWSYEQNPLFRQFFGLPKMPKKFKRELKGLGTGMLMDDKGYILTNNHVAGGATKIEVVLADGDRYPAKLVGADPKTDIAVIRIQAKDPLPHVVFGNSDAMKVGQWVIAIGHPRGLFQTVTQGIVSAKHRTGIMEPSSYQDFLQTDAAINPGNSGGPLLNLQGEVIGVNSAIESTSGGFQGIGFAIPTNMALYVARQLIAYGEVKRGWLGISIQDLTPQLAASFGIQKVKGALVSNVVQGSPADKAGLQRGDVVIRFQGKEIAEAASLRNDVATTPVGTEASLTILRNGREEEKKVTIGSLKEAVDLLAGAAEKRLGVRVTALSKKEAAQYGLKANEGVKVVKVDPKSPLDQAGFEPGDLILGINGQPVGGVESFYQVASGLKPGQEVVLLALDHRTGQSGEVKVTVR
jgi:serine protease Do